MTKAQAIARLRAAERDFVHAERVREGRREVRNKKVRAAIEAGLTYQEIADVTGLARSRVGQIAKLSPVEAPRESRRGSTSE